MSKTNYLQAVISDLQRTAGPYRCANCRHSVGAGLSFRMSDRSLRDIGLSRADVLRSAWGVEPSGDPVEALR